MKDKRIFILLAILVMALLSACVPAGGGLATSPDIGSNPYRSGVEVGVVVVENGDGTYSPTLGGGYGRLVVDIDKKGIPSIEGYTPEDVPALLRQVAGQSLDLANLAFPAEAMDVVNTSGLEHAQISKRGDTVHLLLDGVEIIETTPEGVEKMVSLLRATGTIPESADSIVTMLLNLLSGSMLEELDLAVVTANHDPTDPDRAPFLWPARAERDTFATDGNSAIVVEAPVEPAADGEDVVTLDVRAGEGPWQVAARARDEHGLDFDCAFDALQAHRAAGGAWLAGTQIEISSDLCSAGGVEQVAEPTVVETVSAAPAPAPVTPPVATDEGPCAGLIAIPGWHGVYGDEALMQLASGQPIGEIAADEAAVHATICVPGGGKTLWSLSGGPNFHLGSSPQTEVFPAGHRWGLGGS